MDNHYGKERHRLMLKEAEVTLRNLSRLNVNENGVFGDLKQRLDLDVD